MRLIFSGLSVGSAGAKSTEKHDGTQRATFKAVDTGQNASLRHRSRFHETPRNPPTSPFQGEDRGFESLRGYHFSQYRRGFGECRPHAGRPSKSWAQRGLSRWPEHGLLERAGLGGCSPRSPGRARGRITSRPGSNACRPTIGWECPGRAYLLRLEVEALRPPRSARERSGKKRPQPEAIPFDPKHAHAHRMSPRDARAEGLDLCPSRFATCALRTT